MTSDLSSALDVCIDDNALYKATYTYFTPSYIFTFYSPKTGRYNK